MSPISVFEEEVVNFREPINDTDDIPVNEIREQVTPYLTINNVGKYIIFRDDIEEMGAQHQGKYRAYQIIKEPGTNPPIISLDQDNLKTINITPTFNYGGKTKKTYRKRQLLKYKKNKSKKSKSKKSKKVKSKK